MNIYVYIYGDGERGRKKGVKKDETKEGKRKKREGRKGRRGEGRNEDNIKDI